MGSSWMNRVCGKCKSQMDCDSETESEEEWGNCSNCEDLLCFDCIGSLCNDCEKDKIIEDLKNEIKLLKQKLNKYLK